MVLGILLFLFIIVCIFLTLLILIQSDKGGGISGAIGGGLGGASSLLGTQDTANILTRGTWIFGSAFLLLCVLMSATISHSAVNTQKSVLQKRAQKQQSYSPSSVLQGQGLPMQQSQPQQGQEQQNSAPETGKGAAGSQQQQQIPMTPPPAAQPKK